MPVSPTADLHTHTRYSDGTDTPQRVLELAKQAGLSAIAITDHDILNGYQEAIPIAVQLGLELIPGLEMSASWDGREVHVLGFLIDPAHAAFQRILADQRTRRVHRIHDMVEALRARGLMITAEEVLALAGVGAVGRPHVAQALLKHGYVSTLKEAFDRYIGNNSPAYVPGSPLSPKIAIDAIRAAGGVPVLAHPVYLKDDSLIEQMVTDGLAGVEVYHSSHTPDIVRRYEQLAQRLGLLKTGGTDYHGASKEGLPIGSTKVPYALVDALKEWKRTHTSAS